MKQQRFSNSSWVRTLLVKYIRKHSGEVTVNDVVDVVGRGGVISSELLGLELRALECDGSIRLHEQKYEYSGRRR